MAAGLLTSKATLISMSFLDFAKTVLDTRDVDFLVGSFGYYSELVLMNAYDCLQLMQELDPRTPFYSLNGGLSLVIDELARRIRAMGGIIRTGVQVTGIREHRRDVRRKVRGVLDQFTRSRDIRVRTDRCDRRLREGRTRVRDFRSF